MKHLNKILGRLLSTIFFISALSVGGNTQCYFELSDESGTNDVVLESLLNSQMCDLKSTLPIWLQDSFIVVGNGHYIYDEFKDEDPLLIMESEISNFAQNLDKDYYLGFGRLSNSKSINHTFKVFLNLPEDSCLTENDIESKRREMEAVINSAGTGQSGFVDGSFKVAAQLGDWFKSMTDSCCWSANPGNEPCPPCRVDPNLIDNLGFNTTIDYAPIKNFFEDKEEVLCDIQSYIDLKGGLDDTVKAVARFTMLYYETENGGRSGSFNDLAVRSGITKYWPEYVAYQSDYLTAWTAQRDFASGPAAMKMWGDWPSLSDIIDATRGVTEAMAQMKETFNSFAEFVLDLTSEEWLAIGELCFEWVKEHWWEFTLAGDAVQLYDGCNKIANSQYISGGTDVTLALLGLAPWSKVVKVLKRIGEGINVVISLFRTFISKYFDYYLELLTRGWKLEFIQDQLVWFDGSTKVPWITTKRLLKTRISYWMERGLKVGTSKKKVMLGKSDPYDGSAPYFARAGFEFTHLKWSVQDWKKIMSETGGDMNEIWKLNKAFLDKYKAEGAEFFLSHNPMDPKFANSFYGRELNYLADGREYSDVFIQVGPNEWKYVP